MFGGNADASATGRPGSLHRDRAARKPAGGGRFTGGQAVHRQPPAEGAGRQARHGAVHPDDPVREPDRGGARAPSGRRTRIRADRGCRRGRAQRRPHRQRHAQTRIARIRLSPFRRPRPGVLPSGLSRNRDRAFTDGRPVRHPRRGAARRLPSRRPHIREHDRGAAYAAPAPWSSRQVRNISPKEAFRNVRTTFWTTTASATDSGPRAGSPDGISEARTASAAWMWAET